MPGTLDFACRVSSLFPVMAAFPAGRSCQPAPATGQSSGQRTESLLQQREGRPWDDQAQSIPLALPISTLSAVTVDGGDRGCEWD